MHVYRDGLRQDIVSGSRLQGYTTKANLLAQRVGNLNPTCDQVANRTDAPAYRCADDPLSFGKLSGISYSLVP